MFRLIHISDPHLGPLPEIRRSQLFSKRITGYINWHRNRVRADMPDITKRLLAYLPGLNGDHVAVTGDLINLGLELEIGNAAAWLEELAPPEDATVVLGNHDAYVPGAREKAFAAWQPWVTGDDGGEVDDSDDYPILRHRGDGIALIGCNSARASAPFLATGYFKKGQARRLQKMLESEGAKGNCRIVMIHHPPFPGATSRHKRLIGLKRFMEAVALGGAELILHGHTHFSTLSHIPGANGEVPVVCVPAAYQWPGHSKPPAGVNLFKISRNLNHGSNGNGNGSGWNIVLERHGLKAGAQEGFALISREDL